MYIHFQYKESLVLGHILHILNLHDIIFHKYKRSLMKKIDETTNSLTENLAQYFGFILVIWKEEMDF